VRVADLLRRAKEGVGHEIRCQWIRGKREINLQIDLHATVVFLLGFIDHRLFARYTEQTFFVQA